MKIYRSKGQTDQYGLFGVTSIEFCCGPMAEDILFGRVKTKPWTDHPLVFWVGDYHIKHCGHCGALIEGELYQTTTTNGVPHGWKLVPIEPTEKMFDAGENTFSPSYTGTPASSPCMVWAAMIKAAPKYKGE